MSDSSDYRNRQLIRFESSRDFYATQYNESERALCEKLMLLSTVLIAGVLVFAADDSAVGNLSGIGKLGLLMCVITLIMSMIAGVCYYFTLKRHYLGWAQHNHRMAKKLADRNFGGQDVVEYIENQKAPSELPSRCFIWIQIGFLALSGLLCAAIVAALLFDIRATLDPVFAVL